MKLSGQTDNGAGIMPLHLHSLGVSTYKLVSNTVSIVRHMKLFEVQYILLRYNIWWHNKEKIEKIK